jgi:hypothetical protein
LLASLATGCEVAIWGPLPSEPMETMYQPPGVRPPSAVERPVERPDA